MILKQYKALGLDINTNHIRWVQISRAPHQIALIKGYGSMVKKTHADITETLKSLTLNHTFSKSMIGIALPDSSVQKIKLTLDANLSIIQLKKIFKEAAASLFNQPIKDIHYQYQVLGFSKHQHAQLNFLLIAVEKQTIKTLFEWLKTSHLKPNVIDVESFALERGQEVLKNRQILLEKNLDANDFIKQPEKFTLGLGLAMHPELKSVWSFL